MDAASCPTRASLEQMPSLRVLGRPWRCSLEYPRVEKASGEVVTLKEFLEHVWAAVAKEAITMVFKGADSSGFEEDARLTASVALDFSAGANGDGDDSAEGTDEEGSNPAATCPQRIRVGL